MEECTVTPALSACASIQRSLNRSSGGKAPSHIGGKRVSYQVEGEGEVDHCDLFPG